MYKYLSFIITSGLLTGCLGGSNIKDPMAFDKRPLVKASIMPTKAQLNGVKPKVIIFSLEDGDVELAKKAKIGAAVSNKIETILADTGVEIVDRNLAIKLQKEISLAEIKGNHGYKGPEVADFSVSGKIISTNFSQVYVAPKSVTRMVNKKLITEYIPARCEYSVKVEGTLKVHALPSLSIVDTIAIKGYGGKTQDLEGSSYRHYSIRKSCPTLNSRQMNSLASTAGLNSLNRSKIDLQNNFSPRGYVTEYRVKDDKHIIKITIGKLAGLKDGQDVEIIQSFKSEDQLTGKSTTEEKLLVKGSVSNQVGQSYAWIVIYDQKKAKQIRLGDIVKVRYANTSSLSWQKLMY